MQALQAEESSEHWKVEWLSLELKPRLALVEVVLLAGPELDRGLRSGRVDRRWGVDRRRRGRTGWSAVWVQRIRPGAHLGAVAEPVAVGVKPLRIRSRPVCLDPVAEPIVIGIGMP